MIYILVIIILLILALSIYISSRLFVYIKKLETKVEEQIEKNDNMFQSLKELVHEDYLLTDGRLKKLIYQKEEGRIYNGIKIEEQEIII